MKDLSASVREMLWNLHFFHWRREALNAALDAGLAGRRCNRKIGEEAHQIRAA